MQEPKFLPDLLAVTRRDLSRLPPILDALLAEMDDDLWRARPAPNEWSPLEIVCHLRDEEMEDFGARVRVVLEGGTAFVPIDPERWAIDRRYRDDDPRGALESFARRRRENLLFLGTIEPARLAHAVALGRSGELSGLDLLAAWVTHDRLHVAQLAATLARLGADRWAPLRAAYAGPIPYPPACGALAQRSLVTPSATPPSTSTIASTSETVTDSPSHAADATTPTTGAASNPSDVVTAGNARPAMATAQ
jgi:hypothetical protein